VRNATQKKPCVLRAAMRLVFEDGLGLSAIHNPEPTELADREEFD